MSKILYPGRSIHDLDIARALTAARAHPNAVMTRSTQEGKYDVHLLEETEQVPGQPPYQRIPEDELAFQFDIGQKVRYGGEATVEVISLEPGNLLDVKYPSGTTQIVPADAVEL